ncbi:MAG: hypothetical protein K2K98_14565 [Muribaculaceae bacterium]|nr:hypothetical protein [Muribaculaceae bacterium]
MKTTIKTAVALIAFIASAILCSWSTDETLSSKMEDPESFALDLLNITYNGKTYYNVLTSYDEKGNFVFHDEELSKIYNQELKDLETISFNYIDDNSIEIFNSLNENLKYHGIQMEYLTEDVNYTTRTEVSSEQNFLGTVEIFDDKNFKDRNYSFGILDPLKPYYMSDLKNYNSFNDKCSSLKLTNFLPNDDTQILNMGVYTLKFSEATLVFIGYEDKNYGKSSYTVLAEASENIEVKEFKGFNDKMSSFKLLFAKSGIYKGGLKK